MRTTVKLDDQLLADAKKLAKEMGTTLTAVIQDALREWLSRDHAPQYEGRIHLPTLQGEGLRQGVDLDDSAALLGLLDVSHPL